MRHPKTVSLSFSALSAILIALALPNEMLHWGSPLLGLIALVPLFIAISIAPKPGFVLLVGGVFGFLYHGITSYWLWFFRDFRFWTLGSTSIACFFIYAGVAAWLWVAARSSRTWRPLFLAIGWVGYEYMKSRGFLAYPWGILGYSWNTIVPFNQIADVTGIYGPSLIIAFANAILAEALLRFGELADPSRGRSSLIRPNAVDPLPRDPSGARKSLLCFSAVLLLLFAAAFGYGAFRLSAPARADKTLSAVVVQPNEDSWMNGNEGNRLKGLIELTEEAIPVSGKKPDIILWTENTLDGPYDEWADKRYSRIPKGRSLYAFMKETGIPLFTGGPKVLSWKPLSAQNAVILIGEDGEYKGHYAKVHPVPFAEAIPFWEYEWMRSFMKKAVGLQSGWEMGDSLVIFRVPLGGGGMVRFAAPICFEDAFADLCRDYANLGAELFVNLTNDSWSKTVSAEIQHLVAARYRSIETRRVLVRSTAAGATCWVDSKGRIRDLLPLFTAASALYEVPIELPSSPTAYMLAGDAFAIALICIFILASTILHFMGNPLSRRRNG
jgi:apolipoprotein N-acyltransferase